MPILDIDGMRVAYEDAGTGLPIVFIPGLVGTRRWFRYQVTGLAENYRILSYDLRSAHSNAAYTLDLLTEDLARFLTAMKIQFAVIAGHSFGAAVAQSFAVAYPHMTDALVLISPFPYLPQTAEDHMLADLAPGAVQVETPLQSFMSRIFPPRKPSAPDEEADGLEWVKANTAPLSRRTLASRLSLIKQFNSSDWLPQIEAPALVVVGSQDKAPFLAGAQLIYEGIPDAELEVIEGGDHFCFCTRHDLVNRAIDDFLKERLTRL